MAFQLNVAQTPLGVGFPNAYARIVTAATSRVRSNPEGVKFSTMLDVVIYATEPQNDDVREVNFLRFHTPTSNIESQVGVDFLNKAYSYLKTLPEFEGAVDA